MKESKSYDLYEYKTNIDKIINFIIDKYIKKETNIATFNKILAYIMIDLFSDPLMKHYEKECFKLIANKQR